MNPLYLQNNGFRFMKDLRHNNDAGQRYVCTYIDNGQRCFAKLWRMNSGTILEIGDHNHPATTAMSSNHLPTSSRMAASSSRQSSNGSSGSRRRRNEPTPMFFNQLHEYFLFYSSTEKTYLGQVESCNFSIAYLFGDPQLILQIRDVEEWHIDMTFQCTPMIPKSSLLLTVMIRRRAEVVPMLFVLCSEKSAGLFCNLWQWIGAKVPNVYSNLKTIVCDSDDALEHSIRASIPRAEIKRTWIIVVRAIHRRWNSLDLPKRGSALNKMLFYTSALPFVPPGMMERATTVIEGMFAAHEENHYQFSEMSQFIRTDIVPQANNFSIWTVPWKDRCPGEIFNFALLTHFKENHPSMKTFIEKLPAFIEKGSSLMEKEFKKMTNISQVAEMLHKRLLLNNSCMREFLQIMGYTRPLINTFIIEAIDRRLNFYDDFTDGYRMMVDRNPMGPIPDLDELAHFNPIEVVDEAPREHAEVAGTAIVEHNSVGPVHEAINNDAEIPGMAIVEHNFVGPVHEAINNDAEIPGMAIVEHNSVGPVHEAINDDAEIPGMAIVGENSVGPAHEGRNDDAEAAGMAAPVPVALIAHNQQVLVDNDELFYIGELELLDEPYENNYIHDSALQQVFDDDEAKRDLDLCSVCHLNAKKNAFFPCGHHCICDECLFKLREKYRIENRHRANYIIYCIICRAPSQNIARIHG